jgi:hypothetical protein
MALIVMLPVCCGGLLTVGMIGLGGVGILAFLGSVPVVGILALSGALVLFFVSRNRTPRCER